MKAVVYKGKNQVAVEEVPDPKLEAPGDAIVRITTAAICGSDLHMYVERSAAEPGIVFGHENQGVVEEVGKGVVSIQRGDRVVLPFNIACGVCFNCTRGFTNACLTANPEAPTAGYGYAGIGLYRGGQAEYLRVPYADFNCLKLSGQPGDQLEDDFVLLADIFPTGWLAAELANVKSGDLVAVFGAGPIGPESLRPGEEKMSGVNCAIDAARYQAVSQNDPDREDPMQTIRRITEIINPTGSVGLKLWGKGGIIAGRAKLSFIVSHHLPLTRAEEEYAHFDQRGVGRGKAWTRVLLKADLKAA